MAKVRVHEAAKQFGVQSKEIISYLAEQGIEIKSASSGLEESQVALVEKKFGKANSQPAPKAEAPAPKAEEAAPKAEAPAAKEEKAPRPAGERPAGERPRRPRPAGEAGEKSGEARPKKKKYSTVFNAQYSSTGGSGQQRPRREGEGRRRPEGVEQGRRPQGGRVSIRPEGERHRPAQHSREAEEQARVERERREAAEAARRQAEAEKAAAEGGVEQTASEAEARPANRPERGGEVRVNRDGSRPARPAGERPNRDGSRPARPAGERPNRDGSRPARPAGERPNRDGSRPARPAGERPSRDGSRPAAGGRPGAPAAAASTDPRKKDGRTDNRNKKKKDYDQNNGRRQENFVNLEKNGGKKRGKPSAPKAPERDENEILTLVLPDRITIKDLADKMKVVPSVLVKKLFLKGMMVTVNQEVDYDQAEEIALEFNCICEHEEKVDVIEELLREEDEDEATMVGRPPVVCVMGHVDHGKTSLLDAIRNTKVTDKEAGGITQHIGAYMVPINGQKITFLDTPGHEAFTAMRMRGANSTDIAILVVAADDGVMPQTMEAINHAKAAGIEIIVAINKIDKPGANVDRVKQELSEFELIPEDWGGSTVFVPVSAKTGEGIETLLEMILLTAEVLELKANPKRTARGLVIEAQLDKGRGAVATILVQKGTLHVGDPVSAGSCFGKVRAMIDENGRRLKEAGPSTPVEILGLSDVPNAGEIFVAHGSEKDARSFAQTFIAEGKNRLIEETKSKMSLDDLFNQIQSGNVKELDIIVKADVQGSVEAVKQSLIKLSNDEVVVKVIHSGVGAINESDVILASASNAIIIGFNVKPDAQAKNTADAEGVDVRLYKVIYNAIEDVEAAMKGMLDPIYEEKVIGHAQVRQIFKASAVGNIAGSYVLDGYFTRGCKVRISRRDEQIFEGELASLKRFKDDVKEVKAGYECGLVVEDYTEYQVDDVIEAYIMVEVPR